jgi:hypothetical protein
MPRVKHQFLLRIRMKVLVEKVFVIQLTAKCHFMCISKFRYCVQKSGRRVNLATYLYLVLS